MLGAGGGDDGEQVERAEDRRVAKERRGDGDGIAGEQADEADRRVEPEREALGDMDAVRLGDFRDEVDGDLLEAPDLVAVVDQLLHEQVGGGAEQRRVAHLLGGGREGPETCVAESVVHPKAAVP